MAPAARGCHRRHGRSRRWLKPAGSLKPRRAHTPGGPRQSADDAQQQQQLLDGAATSEGLTHADAGGKAVAQPVLVADADADREALANAHAVAVNLALVPAAGSHAQLTRLGLLGSSR